MGFFNNRNPYILRLQYKTLKVIFLVFPSAFANNLTYLCQTYRSNLYELYEDALKSRAL